MDKMPHMKSPCANCPFRKDSLRGWLGSKRIKLVLESKSFVCHKTTGRKKLERKQCAGHMLLKGEKNHYVLFSVLYEIDLELTGRHLVFDNEDDCIKHHGDDSYHVYD